MKKFRNYGNIHRDAPPREARALATFSLALNAALACTGPLPFRLMHGQPALPKPEPTKHDLERIEKARKRRERRMKK